MKKHHSFSKLAIYLFACSVWLLLVIAFKPNFAKLYELKTHSSHLKQKLILEEKKNYFLKKELNGLTNDPNYIEKVAREKLGWCHPTETVYRFQTQPNIPTLPGPGPSDSNK